MNLSKNFLYRLIQTIFRQGGSIVLLFLATYFLNKQDFGELSYLSGIIFFWAIITDFGFSNTIQKLVTESIAGSRSFTIRQVIGQAIKLVSIIFIISLIIGIPVGYVFLEGDQFTKLIYLLPIVFFVPVGFIYDGVFRGENDFTTGAIISAASTLISLLVGVMLISRFGIWGAIWTYNIFYILPPLLSSCARRGISWEPNMQLRSEIISYSVILGIANLGYFLYTRADMIILGKMGYLEEVGYYEILFRYFWLLILPFILIGLVLAPRMTTLNLSSPGEVKKQAKKWTLISGLISLPLTFVAYFGLQLITGWFFPEYNDPFFLSLLALNLTIVPLSVIEAIVSNGFITPTGHADIMAKTILPIGIINVFTSIWLIGIYGPIGVMIATVILHNIANLVKVGWYFKRST